MRTIIAFCMTFLITAPIQAGMLKELYTSVQEEVASYYQAQGEWILIKVESMEFIELKNNDYLTVSAKAFLVKHESKADLVETCLVTFTKQELEFQSINCF